MRRPRPTRSLLFAFGVLCLAPQALYPANCGHPHAGDFARAADYAALADEVYSAEGGKPPAPWSVVPAGFNEDTRYSSGMQYAIYENKDTGEVVLSFRGSENPLSSPIDWANNLNNGLGLPAVQYTEAMHVATLAREQYGDRLTLTGHSLGGGLATYTAQNLGLPAHVFNPAPVGRIPLVGYTPPPGTPQADITNYVHEDDPLYEVLRLLPTSQGLGRDVIITDEDYNAQTIPITAPFAHALGPMRDFLSDYRDCGEEKNPGDESRSSGSGTPREESGGATGDWDAGSGGLMPPSSPPGRSGKDKGILKPFR